MSLELRVQHLEELVVSLRNQVAALEARLNARSRDSSFDIVPAASTSSATAARSEAVLQSVQEPAAASGRGSTPDSDRAAACREIGLFLRRALSGQHRGTSGRDRLQLQSRLWLVVRTFEGNECSPAIVCTKFSECAALCKRGSDCGDSVFVGLPARRDVLAVAAAAQLTLPASW